MQLVRAGSAEGIVLMIAQAAQVVGLPYATQREPKLPKLHGSPRATWVAGEKKYNTNAAMSDNCLVKMHDQYNRRRYMCRSPAVPMCYQCHASKTPVPPRSNTSRKGGADTGSPRFAINSCFMARARASTTSRGTAPANRRSVSSVAQQPAATPTQGVGSARHVGRPAWQSRPMGATHAHNGSSPPANECRRSPTNPQSQHNTFTTAVQTRRRSTKTWPIKCKYNDSAKQWHCARNCRCSTNKVTRRLCTTSKMRRQFRHTANPILTRGQVHGNGSGV